MTDVQGSLGVFGVIGSRNFGNNLGPIFYPDNMLGKSLMRKYLLNGAGIEKFPQLKLSPSGAAVLWLSVTTRNAQPGEYTAELRVEGGQPIPIHLEVVNVTLPRPFALVGTYCGNVTNMFPFVYGEVTRRRIQARTYSVIWKIQAYSYAPFYFSSMKLLPLLAMTSLYQQAESLSVRLPVA